MKYLLLLGTLALCCSCSTTYYYSTINTNSEHIFRTDKGDFVAENDTLYIIYSFFGEDAPINIGVYNKSNEPIFVDWSQSALIIDDMAQSFASENANVEVYTTVGQRTYSYNNVSVTTSGTLTYRDYLENKLLQEVLILCHQSRKLITCRIN